MTEQEWLNCVEPTGLLRHLEDRADARKLRLFACACCQRVWPLLTRSAVQEAIQTAEAFADGQLGAEELRSGWLAVRKTLAVTPLTTKWEDALMAALNATSEAISTFTVTLCAESAARAVDHEWRARQTVLHDEEDRARRRRGAPEERHYQCKLLRDLFPHQPIQTKPVWANWQHGQIQAMARAIYEEERFQDLPVLADALEEAGCTDSSILSHCRHRAPHVRGCWVVDWLLAGQ